MRPVSPERFDLVVIGSGPAGEKAAAQAAYFGKRVAVVERRPVLGGDAATGAVIPSKTLRETAIYLTGFRRRDVYGLSLRLDPETTLGKLMARTAEVTEATTRAVTRNIERHGIEVVRGKARLGPERVVHVGDRTIQAEVVLIATGSRPHRPATIPFEDPDVYDSEEILDLDRIPSTMAVIGGGAVGCEYASIFAALGVRVFLVATGPRLVPFMDEEISLLLARSFEEIGMRVLAGAHAEAVDRAEGSIRVRLAGGEAVEVEKVLYAAGRQGNSDGLGLEEAGVKVDDRGLIAVDDHFRTSVSGVYAAGDVIGRPALASVSTEQGRVAVCYAFGFPFKETVDPNPPFGVYSIPEAAMVGMTEADARESGIAHEVGRGWFVQNPRASISGMTDGLVKLVFRRGDKVLLGAHVLGHLATELIHVGQEVIHNGGTIDRFIHSTYNIPSRTDAYKYAAYDGLQRLAAISGAVPSPE
jgi:NAD(P) transhydrogenase